MSLPDAVIVEAVRRRADAAGLRQETGALAGVHPQELAGAGLEASRADISPASRRRHPRLCHPGRRPELEPRAPRRAGGGLAGHVSRDDAHPRLRLGAAGAALCGHGHCERRPERGPRRRRREHVARADGFGPAVAGGCRIGAASATAATCPAPARSTGAAGHQRGRDRDARRHSPATGRRLRARLAAESGGAIAKADSRTAGPGARSRTARCCSTTKSFRVRRRPKDSPRCRPRSRSRREARGVAIEQLWRDSTRGAR